MMKNRYQTESPLTPRPITHQSSILVNNEEAYHSSAKVDRISDLYSKFMTTNNQVTIDYDLSAFNMIQFNSKQLKMDFDQQLIVAKLKRLQNNAQLKRINMELQNRKRKTSKHKGKDFNALPQNEKYMNVYQEFLEEKRNSVIVENETHTDSEEEGKAEEIKRPDGVTFFNELKKHPKVLEFTVEQIRSRETLKKQLANSRHRKILQFRNNVKSLGNATLIKARRQANKSMHGNIQNGVNPQKLAQNIFRKIYTKKNKERSIDQVKRDKRLGTFVSKQQMIVDTIDQRSLSKDFQKKLKEKLNSIATQLYMDQRKHNANSALPKLRINKTIQAIK